MNKEYIAVDLDGTLAEYHGWISPQHIGQPIPSMLRRVRKWIKEGKTVKIFTSRACPLDRDVELDILYIRKWIKKYIKHDLEIIYKKDRYMKELWDDKAIQIISNTGIRADGKNE